MRTALVALSLLAASLAPSQAQAHDHLVAGLEVRVPSLAVGLSLPGFPAMVQVPGHPVFYAPGYGANYFFAEDRYWLLRGDRWYASAWYDGPWDFVDPFYVPAAVLRVPVRYYARPPGWFTGWYGDRSPRWGDRWGRGWEERRHGWDRWDHRVGRLAAPEPRRHEERFGGWDQRDRGHDHGRHGGHERGRGEDGERGHGGGRR